MIASTSIPSKRHRSNESYGTLGHTCIESRREEKPLRSLLPLRILRIPTVYGSFLFHCVLSSFRLGAIYTYSSSQSIQTGMRVQFFHNTTVVFGTRLHFWRALGSEYKYSPSQFNLLVACIRRSFFDGNQKAEKFPFASKLHRIASCCFASSAVLLEQSSVTFCSVLYYTIR